MTVHTCTAVQYFCRGTAKCAIDLKRQSGKSIQNSHFTIGTGIWIHHTDGGFINLFDSDFTGNADASVNGGEAGEPLLSAGFYIPTAAPNDRDTTGNPADPITSLTRAKRAGAPPVGGSIDGFDGRLIANCSTLQHGNNSTPDDGSRNGNE